MIGPLPDLNWVKQEGIQLKLQTRHYSVLKQRVQKCEQGIIRTGCGCNLSTTGQQKTNLEYVCVDQRHLVNYILRTAHILNRQIHQS